MLILDATFILIHPLPDSLKKGLTANRMAVFTLLYQQSLNDRLCSDTSMIFTGNPERVLSFHTMITNKNIFDSSSNSMTQVKRTGHVRRWHANYKRWASNVTTRFK